LPDYSEFNQTNKYNTVYVLKREKVKILQINKFGFIYAFSCGRRGTALAVDEELCKYKLFFTPHPSGFACHLPLLGKALVCASLSR